MHVFSFLLIAVPIMFCSRLEPVAFEFTNILSSVGHGIANIVIDYRTYWGQDCLGPQMQIDEIIDVFCSFGRIGLFCMFFLQIVWKQTLWMRWKLEQLFDGKLCYEYSFQELNPSSSYRKLDNVAKPFWHTVHYYSWLIQHTDLLTLMAMFWPADSIRFMAWAQLKPRQVLSFTVSSTSPSFRPASSAWPRRRTYNVQPVSQSAAFHEKHISELRMGPLNLSATTRHIGDSPYLQKGLICENIC